MVNAIDRQRCPDCGERSMSRKHIENGCPATGVKPPAKPDPLGRKESQETLGDPDLWGGGY